MILFLKVGCGTVWWPFNWKQGLITKSNKSILMLASSSMLHSQSIAITIKRSLPLPVTGLQWRCNVCDRVFHGKGCKSQYNRHYKVVHLNIKPFRCDQCGKRFSQKCNRRQHMARHHGADEDLGYALSMLRKPEWTELLERPKWCWY